MRHLPSLVLVLSSIAGGAGAADLGATPAPKSDAHVLAHPASDRSGGETIADAVPIGSLPFSDTGATCDNVDDYDEACPYGSTSPDVVYAFTPAADMDMLDRSLRLRL